MFCQPRPVTVVILNETKNNVECSLHSEFHTNRLLI